MMTEKTKKGIDLGRDPVGRLIVRLAVPAVLAQLINLLYNLVDRMYVGNIAGAVSLFAPQVYGYLFNASAPVMQLLKKYTPFFMAGTVFFFAQMTLQNVFVALNQAKISIFLACLRKVILLIPLCFALPYAFGVSGIYYSEGIADAVAGIVTASTFFALLPRILRKREESLALQK